MTAIWFILALMTAAAVFALLWPLTRRSRAAQPASRISSEQAGLTTETGFYEDQLAEIDRDLARGLIAAPEAEAARAEAARRLLRASREGRADAAMVAEPHLRQRRAASAFALSTIPLVALLVYGLYGSPNLPSQTEADRKAEAQGGRDLMKAIGQIEAKLASNPNDARGWAVLAPVYMRLGRFDDAARAYQAVARLQGEDAESLSNWGEALVAAGEGSVSPEARQVFERALKHDATAAKPQFYLARADELAGDTASARKRLEALVAQGPADAPWMSLVQQNVARLKGEATEAPTQTPGAGGATATNEGAGRDEASGATTGKPTGEAGPAARIEAMPPDARMAAIRGMVDGLDKRLAENGGGLDDWMKLVRSRAALGERDRAAQALARGRAALAGDATADARLDAEAKRLGLDAPSGSEVKSEARDTPPMMPQAPSDAQAGPSAPGAAAIQALPPAERETAIRGMVAGLDRRLAAKGGSVDEWMRLVRSYTALGERDAAAGALDRARMALAADSAAIGRLDTLGRELDLRTAAARP